MRLSVERVLFVFAVAMFLARFLFLRDALFLYDEPLFQMKIDENMLHHAFPLTTFRGSSIALAYGAGALWFYWPVRLFTANPLALVWWHALFFSAGFLFLYAAVKRAVGRSEALLVFLLSNTSCLLFFDARHIWDNTLFVPLTGILLYCVTRLETMSFRALVLCSVFLGLLSGYGLNVHLMFGPVVIATALILLVAAWRKPVRTWQKFLPAAVFSAVFLLSIAPYLWAATHLLQTEHALESTKFKNRWGDGRHFWWLILRSGIFASFWGGQEDLSLVKDSLHAFGGPFLAKLWHWDIAGWFGKLLAWFILFSVPFRLWRRERLPLLLLFAAFSFFSVLLVYEYLNIPMAAHYFHPIWWLPFVAMAYGLHYLHSVYRRFFQGMILLTALIGSSYCLVTLAYLHKNHGARTMGFGTSLGTQIHAVADLCGKVRDNKQAKASVDISQVMVSVYAIQYLNKHLPACDGVELEPAAAAGMDYALVYPEGNSDAQLLVKPRNIP